jgi:hypothetical protein
MASPCCRRPSATFFARTLPLQTLLRWAKYSLPVSGKRALRPNAEQTIRARGKALFFGALPSPQVASVADPSMRSVLGAIAAPLPSQRPCSTSSSDGPVQPNGGPIEASLIKKVQSVHSLVAKAARVQGSVEFTTIIDKTRHVREAQLVKGHPLLVAAASESILQWEYRPLILEIITQAIVNITLAAAHSVNSKLRVGKYYLPERS